MSNRIKIEHTDSSSGLVTADNVAFTFEVSESPRDFSSFRHHNTSLDWHNNSYAIGDLVIHPYGSNNALPNTIREVVQNNADAPGILKKKAQLIWGQGPALYTDKFEDNEKVRTWVEDKVIQQWLDSWDYESFLMKSIVDFTYIEGTFTKFVLNRGAITGNNVKIAKLEHSDANKTRLASTLNTWKPTKAVVGELLRFSPQEKIKVYNIFDFRNPFKYKNAILYSSMYSFLMDYYTVPDIYGSLEWLRRSTAIPTILKALSKNSINLKYHVVSPQSFWDKAETKLKEIATQKGQNYKSQDLADYKNTFLKGVSKVLSGENNTGKFWHTSKSVRVDGTNIIEEGWEINVIDQKIGDFVKSQIEISNHSGQKISTSLGVHTALGNVGEKGKADSGSEQLYAYQNFKLSGIDIPERVICKAINYAIKANFPGKNIKLGFYHTNAKREQDVSEKNRVKNQ